MNKFFDFSEHKETYTEPEVDLSYNAIEYMENLVEIHSNNVYFDNKLEDINSKFDITNTLVNNLRKYGLNTQVASFIKTNYNNNTIDMLVNDIDSLQYGTNKKLADEVATALEAINVREWLNKIITFLKELWRKFTKFIKRLKQTHISLRLSTKQAYKRYDEFIKAHHDLDISNVVYNHNGGLWKLSAMENFVNKICTRTYGVIDSSDNNLNIDKGISNFDEIRNFNAKYTEVLNRINDTISLISNYDNNKKTTLAEADIALDDLTGKFYDVAFKAIKNMEVFATFTSFFEELYYQVNEFAHKHRNHQFTQDERDSLSSIVTISNNLLEKMYKIYKTNYNIVFAYYNILGNCPEYKAPTVTDALLS